MKGLGVTAAAAAIVIAGGAGAVYAADLDTMPTKAPVFKAAPGPATCTNIADFFLTACQLSAYGVRLYGTIDIGGGYQTAGAPLDRFFTTGASYLLQKMNRQAMWGLAPNGLSLSNVGVQVIEPLGAGWKFLFQYDAGFDPYTGEWAGGPGSLVNQIGKPVNQQSTAADSGRNDTWYNGQLFAGVSNDTWGTLTVGRQNSLTLDGVNAYDPMGGSYAFSPIGFSGKVPGAGNTEDARYNESVRYRVSYGNFRFGALVEYGGLGLGNGAEQAFELQAGGDFHVGPGVFSFDVIGGYMKDAVNLGINGSATVPTTVVSATLSDNTNVMVLAKYTIDKLQLSAGYEWVNYGAPSDPARNFTVMDNANTGFNPITTFSNQSPEIFQVFWGGAKYGITDSLDVAVAYYRYQAGAAANAPASCAVNAFSNGSCAGNLNAASIMFDWKFAPKWDTYIGTFYSETNGGLNAGYLAHSNLATTAGIRFRF
jgi:predicted porin